MLRIPVSRTSLAAALLAGSLTLAGSASADGHALSEKVSSGTYVMDKTHGYVTFTYSHFGLSNPQISFDNVDAVLTLDADDPTKSSVNVTIDAASVDSGVEVFNDHLNNDEKWLNTGTFPEITFVSTGLTQADDSTGTLTGDLTVKGVTKPVTLDVTLLGAKEHPISKVETVGVQATTTILRSDFDAGAFAPAVSDEMVITISGEFNKAEVEEASADGS
ncbi:MAG: YceI family protein [Pseudomonadota bacterium]